MHHDLVREHHGAELPDYEAGRRRGHDRQHEAGASDGLGQIVGGFDAGRECHRAGVPSVRPVLADLAHGLAVAHPEAHAPSGQRTELRQGGAPAPAPEHGDFERPHQPHRRLPLRTRGSRNGVEPRP